MPRVCFTVGGTYGLLCRWTVLRFIYTAEHGQVQRHQVHELDSGHHEEADTRLLFHAQYVSQLDTEDIKVIVVRSNDTDVFVLLIHHPTQINAKLDGCRCEFEEYQTLHRHKCNCPETYTIHMLSPAQFPCIYRL